MTFTHLDLFAGIGGFSRAVHWLGGTTVGFVEWDAWNRRVLAKHWPEAHFHGDIKTFTAATLSGWGVRTPGPAITADANRVGLDGRLWADGRDAPARWSAGGASTSTVGIDLITGGYPCQPFSLAGQRLGHEDDRHLWPEMRRVVNLVRPRWVLCENVSGHVSMGLDTVLSDLEADGYACGAVVVPACAVGALHRRDRVWIIASLPDSERGGRGEQLRTDAAQGPLLATEWTQGASGVGSGSADETVSNANRGRHEQCVAQERRLSEFDGSSDGIPLMADAESHLRRASGNDRSISLDRASEPGESRQAPRSVDAGADGLRPRLVRRPAARSPWDDPDMIRQMWADGSWEFNLPRVVAEEPERRQKLQAAGNAIVPIVAYEILKVMMEQAA